jgi:hypothetical protein
MNYRDLGARHVLDILGLTKYAVSLTSTLIPRSTVPKAVDNAESALKSLRTTTRPLATAVSAEHPVQSYKSVMGNPMYKWPSSSKELYYRLHQQTPEALRTPINYAV